MFEATAVLEDEVITKIADTYSFAETGGFAVGKKKKPHATRMLLDREPAAVGEQVAAKANRADEDGSWILATVVEYDQRSNTYFVQDEDDPNRTIHLVYEDVRRLEDISSHLRRGDLVLAVFPETTSFYRAIVAKSPKPPLHHNAVWDVVVKFDDDEDETGKMPARRFALNFSYSVFTNCFHLLSKLQWILEYQHGLFLSARILVKIVRWRTINSMQSIIRS